MHRGGRRAGGASTWVVLGLSAVMTAGTWLYQETLVSSRRPEPLSMAAPRLSEAPVAATFQCDGRQHCSQMASCEEAHFFLQNCPATKMDGDNDGRPCEQGPC